MDNLHPVMQAALAPFAPPRTAEQEANAQAIDAAMLADKQAGGPDQRNYRRALELQVQANPAQWL